MLCLIAIFLFEEWGNEYKTCVYDLEGDRYEITIPVNEECPATIEID